MIRVGSICDDCIFRDKEKKDGWRTTCEHFKDGIPRKAVIEDKCDLYKYKGDTDEKKVP